MRRKTCDYCRQRALETIPGVFWKNAPSSREWGQIGLTYGNRRHRAFLPNGLNRELNPSFRDP
jgi:hypothetical protein